MSDDNVRVIVLFKIMVGNNIKSLDITTLYNLY